MHDRLPVLRFREHFVERIWGGRRLESLYGKALPPDIKVGESWLISDHSSHASVVAEGPYEGQTLRDLIETRAESVLGSGASLTHHGRFPLLLKLLDADDNLSVQVHPDDETAVRLHEPDVGKTEMWHILAADPGSELITGIEGSVEPNVFLEAASTQTVETMLKHIPVHAGDSVFVPAGTVHAIGKGIVLAEIQQNSDLTYRLYDYGRLQGNGQPRELHLDKSEAAIHWDTPAVDVVEPLALTRDGTKCELLAACRYFAAELIHVSGAYFRDTRQHSFHILLAKDGSLTVSNGINDLRVAPGEAVIVPGGSPEFRVAGVGKMLDYYVPDVALDILTPAQESGASKESLDRLMVSYSAGPGL